MLIYIAICLVYGLIIRIKSDFFHTITAICITIVITPLFGKFLYYKLFSDELETQNINKKLHKNSRRAVEQYRKEKLQELDRNTYKRWGKHGSKEINPK